MGGGAGDERIATALYSSMHAVAKLKASRPGADLQRGTERFVYLSCRLDPLYSRRPHQPHHGICLLSCYIEEGISFTQDSNDHVRPGRGGFGTLASGVHGLVWLRTQHL